MLSCECLYQRKYVTKVKLSDKLGNAVWPRLKGFILGQCPNTNEVGTMYMCNYCKSSIKKNKLPPRCVLNGLEPIPIPVELAKLDALIKCPTNSACKMLPTCCQARYLHW